MILRAIAEKPKNRSREDFKGRHFEAFARFWSLQSGHYGDHEQAAE
jgi:hypothetical protein